MYRRTESPTPEQIGNLIKYHAYPQALRNMAGVRWVELDEQKRSMTIGKGTGLSQTIRVNPDGGVDHTGPQDIPLLSSLRSERHATAGIFMSAWSDIVLRAQEELKNAAREVLGDRDNQENDILPRPNVEHNICTHLQRASQGIAASLAGGYVRNPDRYGRKLLHAILGKETVGEAIRMIGHSATLQDINRIRLNREAISEAHRLNPNALVVLFNEYHHENGPDRYHLNRWELDLSSPQAILRQARQAFNRSMDRLYPNVPPERREWERIAGLNQAAVRTFPMNAWTLNEVARLERMAGVPATFTAIRRLGREIGNIPQEILAAYIQESHRVRTTRKGTQRDLSNLLFHIAYTLSSNPRQCCNEHVQHRQRLLELCTTPREAEFQEEEFQEKHREPAPIPEWKNVVDGLPQEVHDRRETQPQGETGRNAARDIISGIIQDGMGRAMADLAPQIVELRSEPGEHVEVWVRGARTPSLEFSTDQGGVIIARTSREWTMPETLPQGEDDQRWNTQGIWARAMTRRAISAIARDPRWQEFSPRQRPRTLQVHNILHRYLQENGVPDQDRSLSRQLVRAVTGLKRPEILDKSPGNEGQPTLREYNLQACEPRAFREAAATSPGAARWVLAYCNPTETIRHPGQVIALARESMFHNGLDRRNWKTAAVLDGDDLDHATGWESPQDAALTINIAAETGSMPLPKNVRKLTQFCHISNTLRHGTGAGNLKNAIILACQAIAGEENHVRKQVQGQFIDIVDYVRKISQDGAVLRSRNWSGLRKASERWHRRQRQDRNMAQWEEIMSRRRNGPMHWDSLLPETSTESGISIVPLTGEEELRDEAARMAHCVISYGPQCAQGKSRIFSLRRGEETLATGEILRHNSAWRVSQVRGFMNQNAGPELEAIMENLAMAYTRAEQKTATAGHP